MRSVFVLSALLLAACGNSMEITDAGPADTHDAFVHYDTQPWPDAGDDVALDAADVSDAPSDRVDVSDVLDAPADSADAHDSGVPAGCIDADGDGWPVMSESCPWTGGSWDCNDADPTIYPGAPETICDDVDRRCAGTLTVDPCTFSGTDPATVCSSTPAGDQPLNEDCARTLLLRGDAGATFWDDPPRCVAGSALWPFGHSAGGYIEPNAGTRECEACHRDPSTGQLECQCWTSGPASSISYHACP